MSNLKKDTTAEVIDISNLSHQICAETKELQRSNDPPKTTDRLIDTLPGTSKFCSRSSSNVQDVNSLSEPERADGASLHSIESFVCRICHNNENPDKLISPCLCKGSLTYVHSECLERWISMSRCTTCELCQFQYNTVQTLRYTFYQSLRMWYSRSMSRRALQEDCQMFLLLTLIAFGIVGTLLVAVQYYIFQSHISGLGRIWTRGWLIFFLVTTLLVYLINVYMIVKAQLLPWYRWWQTARDIRLIIENHNPTYASLKQIQNENHLNSSPEATEESICQAVEMCCSQQNPEIDLKSDEIHQNKQHMFKEVGAARQIITNSLRTFCSKNCNKYDNQLGIPIEKMKNTLEMQPFEASNVTARNTSTLLNRNLETATDSLVLTI